MFKKYGDLQPITIVTPKELSDRTTEEQLKKAKQEVKKEENKSKN